MRRRTGQPGQPSDEAQIALQQARRALLDAERRDAAAADVAARLQEVRGRNGFGDAWVQSMRRT